MIKRTRIGWTVLAGFIALCIWILNTESGFLKNINLGIDLQGGTELQYKLDLSSIKGAADSEVTEEIKNIISNRLDIYGLKEIRIAIEGTDRLVVTIPGGDSDSTKFIMEQVSKAGKLDLQLVVSSAEHIEKIPEYKRIEREYEEEKKRYVKKWDKWDAAQSKDKDSAAEEPEEPTKPEFIVRSEWKKNEEGKLEEGEELVLSNLDRDRVGGEFIARAGASTNPEDSSPMVTFSMKAVDEGAGKLGQLTNDHINSRLAVVLDGQVRSAPVIRGQISNNGQITGKFTRQEVTSIVTILNGGSLPTSPELISRNTVGSLLGEKSVQSSKNAILLGIMMVMGSIALYYLVAGLVANFALAFNIMAVLAYVACFRQTLTLPGVAGILLTIGMAIDANILIFERVREERLRGKTLLQSLTTGYQRAFSVIFDSNLTTVITGLVLFNFGTGPVKGFAITLIAGIIISFISALFVTRLILSWLLNVGLLKELKMLSAFSTPSFSFSRIQKPFMVISVLVIIGSWIFVIPRGMDNYGIDFNGGARVGFTLKKKRSHEEVWRQIDELKIEEARSIEAQRASGVPRRKIDPAIFKEARLQVLGEGQRMYILLTRVEQKKDDGDNRDLDEEIEELKESLDKLKEKQRGVRSKGDEEALAKIGEEREETLEKLEELELLRKDEEKDVAAQVAEDVRDKIREKFTAMEDGKGWLIPEPYDWDWQVDADAASGKEVLVLTVNFDHQGEQAIPQKDELKKKLNEALAEDAEDLSELKIQDCKPLSGAGAGESVASFELKFAGFNPGDQGQPSREQAQEAVRAAFKDDAVSSICTLSEPFFTVTTVGATVSSDLQQKAIVAFFISILAIIFYVSLRFEFYFGLAAIAALLHDVLISIGIIALVDQFFPNYPLKINLPEIAALLTIIGYSINDTIVVFDRIRENLKIYGKNKLSFRECVDLSINQTLSRTLLTSATTLMTVCSLLVFGGEAIRGFAFTFLVGLTAGTYSSVFIASPILIMLRQRALQRREAAAQV